MLESEHLIPISDVPDYLPKRNGKKINLSTVYRWRHAGLRGIRLEWCIHGGIPCSSTEAIARFDRAVSEKIVGRQVSSTTPAAQSRAHDIAKQRLMDSGIIR